MLVDPLFFFLLYTPCLCIFFYSLWYISELPFEQERKQKSRPHRAPLRDLATLRDQLHGQPDKGRVAYVLYTVVYVGLTPFRLHLTNGIPQSLRISSPLCCSWNFWMLRHGWETMASLVSVPNGEGKCFWKLSNANGKKRRRYMVATKRRGKHWALLRRTYIYITPWLIFSFVKSLWIVHKDLPRHFETQHFITRPLLCASRNEILICASSIANGRKSQQETRTECLRLFPFSFSILFVHLSLFLFSEFIWYRATEAKALPRGDLRYFGVGLDDRRRSFLSKVGIISLWLNVDPYRTPSLRRQSRNHWKRREM